MWVRDSPFIEIETLVLDGYSKFYDEFCTEYEDLDSIPTLVFHVRTDRIEKVEDLVIKNDSSEEAGCSVCTDGRHYAVRLPAREMVKRIENAEFVYYGRG